MVLVKNSVAALSLLGTATAALQPIEMKGQKFFYKNGTQFYMKGIAYQEDIAAGGEGTISDEDSNKDFLDPLADETKCKRDVPFLKQLGINTIRTYAIKPDADHDACMKLLDDAGIYVVSDLSQPKLSINRDDAQWNTELLERYTDVVDSLAKYDNVIGFFGGNEVSNNKTNTIASAYVKAAIRDTKKHIKSKYNRWLGVGYASNDDADIRGEIAQYFNCGEQESSIDFWGYNIYSWCGKSDMEKSGYDKQVEFFSNYSVPVFFAEYGCNNQKNGAESREFDETAALYSDEMTGVFSGGIVYMYFQETNDYGVVKVNKGKVETMKNFDFLAKQHKAAKPKTVERDEYQPANDRPATCPAVTDSWKVSANALPPVPDSNLCSCMVKSRECVPKSSLSPKNYGELFGFICGKADEMEDVKAACKAINGDPEAGLYGAYSMCRPAEKLAYVMDAYYKATNKAFDACDYDGAAETQSAKDDSKCTDSLKKADDHNKDIATASGSADGPAKTGDNNDDSFGIRSTPLSGALMMVAAGLGAGMAML
jgi:hypothetical protein